MVFVQSTPPSSQAGMTQRKLKDKLHERTLSTKKSATYVNPSHNPPIVEDVTYPDQLELFDTEDLA